MASSLLWSCTKLLRLSRVAQARSISLYTSSLGRRREDDHVTEADLTKYELVAKQTANDVSVIYCSSIMSIGF